MCNCVDRKALRCSCHTNANKGKGDNNQNINTKSGFKVFKPHKKQSAKFSVIFTVFLWILVLIVLSLQTSSRITTTPEKCPVNKTWTFYSYWYLPVRLFLMCFCRTAPISYQIFLHKLVFAKVQGLISTVETTERKNITKILLGDMLCFSFFFFSFWGYVGFIFGKNESLWSFSWNIKRPLVCGSFWRVKSFKSREFEKYAWVGNQKKSFHVQKISS